MPRNAAFAALLTGVFVAGFIGQGRWPIGARPASVAVSAAAVEVVGGAGTRQPVRAVAQVTITNQGSDGIRLDRAAPAEPNVVPVSIDPRDRRIGPGRSALVNITLLLDCRSQAQLALPVLHIALPDGARRTVPVTGTGRLVEACQRSGPTTRSLSINPIGDDDRLALRLAAPAGRAIRVLGLRAGGVPLGGAGLPVVVAREGTTLAMVPPADCPVAWNAAGVPGTLSIDTDDGAGGAPATLPWKGAAALTDWLLTACGSP